MDWALIGKRIRQQREYLGLTREALAEKIDVTPKFCSDIETGVKGMSVPTLCRIAGVLHLSVDYILFGSEQNQPFSAAVELLKNCPADKREYLESIIKTFLLSMDN